MPRKPKLPPIPELHIESLSTGRVIRPKSVPSDFDGEPIPIAQDSSPIKPLRGADVIQAERQRQAQADKQKLWTMLKPDKMPQLGQQVELIPKGKRKIAEWGGKAVLITMPKWRRF